MIAFEANVKLWVATSLTAPFSLIGGDAGMNMRFYRAHPGEENRIEIRDPDTGGLKVNHFLGRALPVKKVPANRFLWISPDGTQDGDLTLPKKFLVKFRRDEDKDVFASMVIKTDQ